MRLSFQLQGLGPRTAVIYCTSYRQKNRELRAGNLKRSIAREIINAGDSDLGPILVKEYTYWRLPITKPVAALIAFCTSSRSFKSAPQFTVFDLIRLML